MSGDKLVVGYQEFRRTVAGALAASDGHSCEQQTRPDFKAMATQLWNMGYRFDPEARVQWLVVEMRGLLSGMDAGVYFEELLKLLEVEA